MNLMFHLEDFSALTGSLTPAQKKPFVGVNSAPSKPWTETEL
jgi:hypothetical protein